jgi:RHS repeat-associated protein
MRRAVLVLRSSVAALAAAVLASGGLLAQAAPPTGREVPVPIRVPAPIAHAGGFPRVTDTLSLPTRLQRARPFQPALPSGSSSSLTLGGSALGLLGGTPGFTVNVSEANPGADIERSACVTVAIRSNAAYECGDLRLTYALPAIRVFNQTRNAMLLYNSQHARPTPIVRAWVTRATGTPVPNSVAVTLTTADGVQRAQGSWSGAAWNSLAPAQVALSFDAPSTMLTNLYDYTLAVTFYYPGGAQETQSATGELAVVNRATSEFGRGWWVAGYERVIEQPSGSVFWIGGDGSTRLYRAAGTTTGGRAVYRARTLTGPDSLTIGGTGLSRKFYRHLARGAYVQFDGTGRHEWTVNAVGQVTKFQSLGICGRLTQIELPLPAGTPNSKGWYFSSSAPNDCAALSLNNGVAASDSGAFGVFRWMWRYIQPTWGSLRHSATNATTLYGEENGRITTWRDVRGVESAFTYGAGGLLTVASTPAGGTALPVIQYFRAGEAAALASPDVEANLYTALYSLRWGEVSVFKRLRLGPWGNPTQLVDELGRETLITPDVNFPLLAARVRQPNGYSSWATYEPGTGNLLTLTTDPRAAGEPSAVTTYTYQPGFSDNVASVTDPTGLTTTYGYGETSHGVYPMLVSQQTGPSAARRAEFEYCWTTHCYGLSSVTVAPEDGSGNRSRDSVFYDALGNLRRTLSQGGKCAEFENDGIGRLVSRRERYSGSCRTTTGGGGGGGGGGIGGGTCPPVCLLSGSSVFASEAGWVTTNLVYDRLERDSVSVTIAPADGTTPEQRIETRTFYDGFSSLVTKVQRRSLPDSTVGWLTDEMRYDALGRLKGRRAQGMAAEETFDYDRASNTTEQVTARGDHIVQHFDAINRLWYRITPAVTFPAETLGTALLAAGNPALTPSFPRLPLGALARTIDRDSASFSYDFWTGQIETANNKDALVSRTYFADGLLKGEVQSLRSVAENTFGNHVYSLSYGYDRAGRRTRLTHPSQLAPGTGLETWTYDTVATGLPSAVQPPLGGAVSFTFDPAGQLIAQVVPGGIRREFTYTADGETASDVVRNWAVAPKRPLPNLGGNARAALLEYDIRGKLTYMTNSVGRKDKLRATYSPIGHLRASSFATQIVTASNAIEVFETHDTTTSDALGNTLRTWTWTNRNASGSPGFWPRIGVGSSNSELLTNIYRTNGTGQLGQSVSGFRYSFQVHDVAGNMTQQRTPGATPAQVLGGVKVSERVLYHDASNRLIAVDAREGPLPGADAFANPDFLITFDAYRYDALGRRVFTRSSRKCPTLLPTQWEQCQLGFVRRVVWDGERELYEIKMPDDSLVRWQNDTATLVLPIATQPGSTPTQDINGHFGRVGYVYGGAIDRPLVVMRMGYADNSLDEVTYTQRLGYKAWAPFVLYPQWDMRGEPGLGSTGDGGLRPCEGSGTSLRCSYPVGWSGVWSPTGGVAKGQTYNGWVGSLLEDKRDPSGLLYRRNRYLDASTGRFTQPDPIGLGGGLNSYGYASGDAVNFSDPFGLCEESSQSSDSTKVEVCSAPVDLPVLKFIPFMRHRWIRTSAKEAGLGTEGGGVPGEGDYQSAENSPYLTMTSINDHTGRGNRPGSTCTAVPGLNARCANRLLNVGQRMGRWTADNNCVTLTMNVVTSCGVTPNVPADATRVVRR